MVCLFGDEFFSLYCIYMLVLKLSSCGYYRYVATAVTSVHEMENGFNIWSFNGKLLYRILKDHFFQVISFFIGYNRYFMHVISVDKIASQ